MKDVKFIHRFIWSYDLIDTLIHWFGRLFARRKTESLCLWSHRLQIPLRHFKLARFSHWAILYYWRTCSASTSEAKNMADLTPLPWLLVPRFMATTTVPTAVLSFRRCTSPPWFQVIYLQIFYDFAFSLVFEVKITLKILIFFSYNLVDLQRRGSCLFAPLVDVWDVQEEYF
jgi:hypothetical protein